MKTFIRDVASIYRNNGVRGAVYAPVHFVRQVIFEGVEYQTDRRVDIDHRWELMRENVSESDVSLLDIGCAEGVLTERFSELGMFCVGVDVLESRLSRARKRETTESDVRFLNYKITPENVRKLPSFDVVLLLTVYYHWCREYGQPAGEEMFRELARKSNKMFYQPPGAEFDNHPFDTEDTGSIVEGYQEYLNRLFDGQVDTEYLGTTDYRGKDRRDPLFVLDCSRYERTTPGKSATINKIRDLI
jgi:hypothetical protein